MARIAVYPGSFDPPTLGHMDIVRRASGLFDELIVAVGINRSKSPFLTVEERVEALGCCTSDLPNVRVDSFSGLLIDYAKSVGACAVIRGLRAIADFEYEFQMAMVNRELCDRIESVFLMTNWEHGYVSSGIVKEIAMFGGEYRSMVPDCIVPIIERAVRSHRSDR